MRHTLSTLSILLTLAIVTSINAATNSLHYQGQVSDAAGQPVADGSYNVEFRLFTEFVGGLSLWSESRSVAIADGLLNVDLGTVTPLTPTIISDASYLEIVIEGELLSPRFGLGSTPASFLSSRLQGDLISGVGTLSNPKPTSWLAGPPAAIRQTADSAGGVIELWGDLGSTGAQLKLEGNSDGGRLGIWGTGGTTLSRGAAELQPQVELQSTPDGGQLGIWGTGGTTVQAYTFADSGMLGIWGTGGTTITSRVVGDSEVVSIWGTGGTTVESGAFTDSAVIGIWGTGGTTLPQVQATADVIGGRIGIWGTGGTTIPRIEFRASDLGGTFTLRSTSASDGSVNLPDSAINSSEILDETGISQNHNTDCVSIASSSVMIDLTATTITIPADGYIFLIGNAICEFNGTTAANRVDIQIDESAGGTISSGIFQRVGLNGYTTIGFNDFSVTATRTYFKTAGTYTFRFEGMRLSGSSGSVTACFPTLTAVYLPTSYGTVTTVSESAPASDGGTPSVAGGSRAKTVDLRVLEIKAKQAKIRALEAERELLNALGSQ